LKNYECVEVKRHKEVGKTIEESQNKKTFLIGAKKEYSEEQLFHQV
jgi:hypothetical protein